jgi:hypothetical protein
MSSPNVPPRTFTNLPKKENIQCPASWKKMFIEETIIGCDPVPIIQRLNPIRKIEKQITSHGS